MPPLPGLDPRRWTVSDPRAIVRFIRGLGAHVIYVAGYGELGYEDPGLVERVVAEALAGRSPSETVLHTGTLLRVGGEDGIAGALRVARARGVVTTGVHPSVCVPFASTHRVSAECDHVFFVEDGTWGGLTVAGRTSPTLQVHLEVSDELLMVGGGRHAAQELRAFSEAGKQLRYVPARMNHAAARAWCARAGLEPLDPRGEAHLVWKEMNRGV